MSLISIILLSSFSLNTVLGLFVFLGKSKMRANLFYFLLVLFVSTWIISNYAVDYVNTYVGAWILSTIAYESILGLSCMFYYFCIYFPSENVLLQHKLRKFIPYIIIMSGLTTFIPGFVIKNIVISPWKIYTGAGINIIFLVFIFVMVCSFVLLLSKLKSKNVSGADRVKIKLVLTGTAASTVLGAIFNLFFPYLLNNYDYIRIGPAFTLLMVVSIAIAIVKYQLFNIKVIATQSFVIILCVFLFIRTLAANQLSEQLINGVLFISCLIISIFLVRSVTREVSQREKIELLAADLQKANARLTELDRQKSEFVSFATHQLRSPLTAMKGYASLMLEGDLGELPQKAKEGVQRIYESTNTLVSIVNDYLNITRIELGAMKYAFETVDLKSLVEDVIGEIKPNIDKSGLQFSFEADKSVTNYRITADRDKLKQVIANLIDNSVKYTPKGFVKVTLHLDKPMHKFIFKVADSGVGISAETMPHLFQKFSRAENANKTNIRGTGLGLYVAKEIVEAHHGKIYAKSAGEGKGSEFIVEIEPLAKA